MKSFFRVCLIILLSILYFSCEAFFTSNWFQGAADISNITAEEALNSGDPEIMQQVFDQLVIEAADATGTEASELYLQAADLALGISGLSDPAILFEAPELLSGGDGSVGDMFAILTETNLDLDALEDVGVMIANAEGSDPGSVPGDMWLFAAAGNGAAVVNDAADAGKNVTEFLDGYADPLDNTDAKAAVQSLVYALDVLPDDLASEILDNQADLVGKGIIFP